MQKNGQLGTARVAVHHCHRDSVISIIIVNGVNWSRVMHGGENSSINPQINEACLEGDLMLEMALLMCLCIGP